MTLNFDCIRAPPRRGRHWEIHPRRPICRDPRDFPRAKPEGNLEGRGKSERFSKAVGFAPRDPRDFPEGEARGKSRGSRGAKPTAEENLEGGGDGFPNTSRVLVEHGHSLIITREGLIDNFILSFTVLISPSSGSFLIKAGTLTKFIAQMIFSLVSQLNFMILYLGVFCLFVFVYFCPLLAFLLSCSALDLWNHNTQRT